MLYTNYRLLKVLEIFRRFPTTDTLKPYVPTLMKTVRLVLEQDNEENGLLCLAIMLDMHKVYRPKLESEVQPFINFVQLVYRKLDATVAKVRTDS